MSATHTEAEEEESSMSMSIFFILFVLGQYDMTIKNQFCLLGFNRMLYGNCMSLHAVIFFVLSVLALCILVVHLLIKTDFHYLPESVAVIFVGKYCVCHYNIIAHGMNTIAQYVAVSSYLSDSLFGRNSSCMHACSHSISGLFVGLVVKLLALAKIANWQAEEHFPPTMFFLILLPPIIFESGYNLHKVCTKGFVGSALKWRFIYQLKSVTCLLESAMFYFREISFKILAQFYCLLFLALSYRL